MSVLCASLGAQEVGTWGKKWMAHWLGAGTWALTFRAVLPGVVTPL